MHRLLVCALATVALAACGESDEPRTASDPACAESARLRVAVHGGTPKQATRVLEVADTAWGIAAHPFGAEDLVPAPTKPILHLYVAAGGFDEADARLAGGRYAENRAFASRDTLSAHVDLQPRLGEVALAGGGLPVQTERLIAHETAHLVRYALVPNSENHRRWLTDGTAILAADRTMRQLHGGFGPEAEPFTSTLIALAQRAKARGDLPTYDELLAGRTDDLGFLERYAVHYAAMRLLIEGPHFDQVERFLHALRTDPPEDAEGPLQDRLATTLGLADLTLLDEQLAGYLDTLRPQWVELRRSLETTPPRWDHVAYGDGNAVAWRLDDAGLAYALSGIVSFRRGARGPMSVLLGRQADGHLAVTFTPGEGATVVRRREKDGVVVGSVELGRASVRGLPDGWPFEIVVDGTSLEVLLDGLPSIQLHRRPDEVDVRLEGPWGLEVHQGAAGAWEGFEIVKER